MAHEKSTFCRICEPACPIRVSFDSQGAATKLAPNPDHPSGGLPCHKGLSFLEVHNSPDRLNWPLKRQNRRSEHKGEFTRVSWTEAFGEIGEKIQALKEEHGPNSVAFFLGNPSVFDSRGFASTMPLLMQFGSKMIFSSGTQDCTNKFRGSYDLYGTRSIPIPDLSHTNYLLCMGANPKISHWTLMSQPNDALAILKQIKARGGKTVFVNPRKTESSTPETGETLRIKPGTDVYFLAAVLNEIASNNGIDHDHVAQHGKNLDALLLFAEQYPAEKVSEVTGVSVQDIKQVAQDFASADGAAVYISTGIAQSGQGILAYWLSEMINFITGNLGRKGGTFIPSAFFNNRIPMDVAKLPTFQTGIGELTMPPPGGALPSVIIPDLIESGDIKALVVLSGNPLLTVGGETRMRKALEKLEMLVTIDIMLNATSEMAHFALPATSWLERADINLVGNGMQGGKAFVHYTDAMEPPRDERKEDWWIVSGLAQAVGIPSLLDQPKDVRMDGFSGINGMLGQAGLSLEQVKNSHHQTVMLPEVPYDNFYNIGLLHADKKVECFPPAFESSGLLDRCAGMFHDLTQEPDGLLKLGNLRTNHMHNSWMSNVGKLRKGVLERNPLHMCKADAEARGLFDGDEVSVFNEHGRIQTTLRISDDLRPGAVAMSHGYSQSNYALSIASEMRGANCNQLMPASADSYEPLSNMSRLCAVPVEVELA